MPFHAVSFLGTTFAFVRCLRCDFVYQDPLLDGESRRYIYETLDYWSSRQADSAEFTMLNYYDYLADAPLRERNAKLRINWMRRFLRKDARILDLGCSDGLFVNALSKAGYRASGIDISAAMIDQGRERYGVDIRQADFGEAWPFEDHFDAITCFASFSNFVHPSRVFANIRKNLRMGGSLFFNYGDHGRALSRLFGGRLYLYRPTVATIYTRGHVNAYCKKHGLHIETTINDQQIVPLGRLFNFLGLAALVSMLRLAALDDAGIKMTLLTGYASRAVRVT